MKKLLLRLLLFTLPFIVLAYFADLYISKNLRKSYQHADSEYNTWNDLIEGKINADIVINGGSRAWTHIDAPMMYDSLHISTYNIGIDGYAFGVQSLRHKLLLQYNKAPKLIIHTVDVSTLTKRKDLFNSDQFLPYMLWNKTMKDEISQYKGFSFFDYEIPMIRYYGKLDAIADMIKVVLNPKSNIPIRNKGFYGVERTWDGALDKAKKDKKYVIEKIDTATLQHFENYIIHCKTHHIDIIFVNPPWYIEGQKFVKNWDENMSVFYRFSKKYDIPFYDFSNDSMCYQKEYFKNSAHLNKSGAEKFTQKFIDTLRQSPIIKEIQIKTENHN